MSTPLIIAVIVGVVFLALLLWAVVATVLRARRFAKCHLDRPLDVQVAAASRLTFSPLVYGTDTMHIGVELAGFLSMVCASSVAVVVRGLRMISRLFLQTS